MYADLDALRARLGDVYVGIYGAADSEASDDLAAAAAEIDGRLAARYQVPVADPPGILKNWNLTLAEELAYSRGVSGEFPAKLQKRVDEVRKQLADAAAGTLKLAAAETSTGSYVAIDIQEPVFTREKMRDF